MSVTGLGELRVVDGPFELKGNNRAPVTAVPPVVSKDAAPAAPAKKSGLGRQFGRLGGAVSGKNKRNQ